jgi:hypothetical protein
VDEPDLTSADEAAQPGPGAAGGHNDPLPHPPPDRVPVGHQHPKGGAKKQPWEISAKVKIDWEAGKKVRPRSWDGNSPPCLCTRESPLSNFYSADNHEAGDIYYRDDWKSNGKAFLRRCRCVFSFLSFLLVAFPSCFSAYCLLFVYATSLPSLLFRR